MNDLINVTRSSMPNFEEYCEEIKELWDTHWLTNIGVKHKAFEAQLCEYLGAENVSLYVNGHLALENVIAAFGLKGEIITTPFTFASTTHAIVRNGCTPVFCDIKPDDYTIDADKIEALINENTVAIIPVHVYGNICDVEKIQEIAEKYNLIVIYDAAHSFGVTYNGVSSANFGDASMFSFHATKVFNSIEGGAIVYKNPEMTQVLKDLKNFGIHGPESVAYIGGNAKMNEFAAAMGICNLRHIDVEIEKRCKVYKRYFERLGNIKGITLNTTKPGIKHNFAYFPVVFDGYKYTRDEIFQRLKENNIIARKYFYPIVNDFDCYKGTVGFDSSKTPVAKYIGDHVLTLPIYADLSIEDVDRICDIILG